MVELGKINTLKVKRTRDYGAHLDGGELGDILLKHKEVPANCQPGDAVEVFVYADQEGRPRATTRLPCATVGEFAFLPVVANTATGAYLEWGLEKDLFVPKSLQREPLVVGNFYLVHIFIDEQTHRLTASTKIDAFLNRRPPDYQEGEEVSLIIYEQTNLGYKAVVNQTHGGVVYQNEVFRELTIGQQLTGYIKKIREDQKIDLTLQKQGAQRIDAVSQTILQVLIKNGGRLAVTDKTPPEEIYALFGVSKKTFKKAVGGLYKKRLITIDADSITRVRT